MKTETRATPVMIARESDLRAFDATLFTGTTAIVEVLISPDGVVRSTNGDFILDEESFRLIEERRTTHGVEIPFDRDHHTVGGYEPPSGESKAAGWIKSLRYERGKGLFAAVEWTPRARQEIRDGEYRYPSPAFFTRKEDRKVVGLHSVAMVNRPAISNIPALAAKDSNKKETDMDELKLIAKALGVAETEPVETLVNKIGELMRKAEGAPETAKAVAIAHAARKALGLKDDADASAVEVALNSHKQAKDAATTQAEELKALKERFAEREADDLMRPFIAANKINPNATEDVRVCRDLAKRDPETFKKLMAERPALVEPGRTQPPGGGAKSGGGKEDELIANAVKEHKGHYGDAVAALQVQLKQPYLDQGLTNRAANDACVKQYPKIFEMIR